MKYSLFLAIILSKGELNINNKELKIKLELFKNKEIRKVWSEKEQEWYFSIIDIVGALTDSANPRKYWSVLKTRLKYEGSQLATNCSQLKLKAFDNKYYLTDVASVKDILRLIQSIPSPNAEPFKLWLARVGNDRLDEINDPEQAIINARERAYTYYKNKGFNDKWIQERIKSIETRNLLTDEYHKGGITEKKEFAKLTDILTYGWSGKTTREYKNFKGLTKENLRDNMTNTEIALNNLAEIATTEILKKKTS